MLGFLRRLLGNQPRRIQGPDMQPMDGEPSLDSGAETARHSIKSLASLEDRIIHILSNPYTGGRWDRKVLGGLGSSMSSVPDHHGRPTLDECLKTLREMPPTPESLRLIEKVVRGEFDFGPFDAGQHTKKLLNHPGPPKQELKRSYEVFYTLHWHFPDLIECLQRNGQFTYEAFRDTALHMPSIMDFVPLDDSVPNLREGFSPEHRQILVDYACRLVSEIAEDLTDQNCEVMTRAVRLRGSRFLVRAAHYHSALRLGKLSHRAAKYGETVSAAVAVMAEASGVEPDSQEDYERLLAELKQFPATTLQRLLPIAQHGRRILCEAIGWTSAIPLVEQIVRAARIEEGLPDAWGNEERSSSDPTFGALDVAAVKAGLRDAGEDVARKLIKLFREAAVQANQATMLIETVAGWNRDQVLDGVAKRNQPSVRACGLIPLERGIEEARERYLYLKKFIRDSKQFGMMRQTSEKGAAAAALENLARNAGFTSVTRMEWAFESLESDRTRHTEVEWRIGDYTVGVEIEGKDAHLAIRQGDKRLKTVPAAVKSDKRYPEMQQTLKDLREQAKRFVWTLEETMVSEDPLIGEELANLARNPVARKLLERLILKDGQETFGFFSPDPLGLRLLDDSVAPITGSVLIAHSYHLFQAGQLAAWQRKLVHEQISQPFKQAYRELYVITPPERETHDFSNRFTGHFLDSATAGRLLHSRGWTLEACSLPYKILPRAGVEAIFDFPDAGEHYFAENPAVTSDRIFFMKHPTKDRFGFREQRIPLAEIPPLVFSEVMRDADLVVSVAQRGEGAIPSDEAIERRAQLVLALVEELRLQGVRTEGHFAHIQGKLAQYRVHLGSAAIHIEPGSYLCVVPDRWGKTHENLFLPFAEADDKTAEVISKVLLLVNDDKIKDLSIRTQILMRR